MRLHRHPLRGRRLLSLSPQQAHYVSLMSGLTIDKLSELYFLIHTRVAEQCSATGSVAFTPSRGGSFGASRSLRKVRVKRDEGRGPFSE